MVEDHMRASAGPSAGGSRQRAARVLLRIAASCSSLEADPSEAAVAAVPLPITQPEPHPLPPDQFSTDGVPWAPSRAHPRSRSRARTGPSSSATSAVWRSESSRGSG
jgi:hypothetical protein